MAGIGHEVRPHLLDPPQRREVVERQQHQIDPGGGDRGHDRLVPAVDRHALEELDALCAAAGARAADGVEHLRHPQAARDRLAPPQRWRNRARPRVERDHVALTVERNHRIREPRQHRLHQRIADPQGRRRVPLQGSGRADRPPGRDHRHGCDQNERDERRKRGKLTGHPQAGEHHGRRRQRETAAPEPVGPPGRPLALAVACDCHRTPDIRACGGSDNRTLTRAGRARSLSSCRA